MLDAFKLNSQLSKLGLSLVTNKICGEYQIIEGNSNIITSLRELKSIIEKNGADYISIRADEGEWDMYGPLTRYKMIVRLPLNRKDNGYYEESFVLLVDNKDCIVICTDDFYSYDGVAYHIQSSVFDSQNFNEAIFSSHGEFICQNFLEIKNQHYFARAPFYPFNVACFSANPPQFLYCLTQSDFKNRIYKDNIIICNSEDKFGLLNKDGIRIADFIYDIIYQMGDYFRAVKDRREHIIDGKGNILFSGHDGLNLGWYDGEHPLLFGQDDSGVVFFDESVNVRKRIPSVKLINKLGNVIFLEENGKSGYNIACYNAKNDKYLFNITPDSMESFSLWKTEPSTVIIYDGHGHYGLANTVGDVLIAPMYDTLEHFGFHQLLVSANGRYGIVSGNNEIIVPLVYDRISAACPFFNLCDEMCRCCALNKLRILECEVNGKSYKGILDSEGIIVAPIKYDEMSLSNNFQKDYDDDYNYVYSARNIGYIYLRCGDKEGVFNVSKRKLIDASFDKIIAHRHFAIVINNQRYGLVDYNGRILIPVRSVYIIASPMKARISDFSSRDSKIVRVCESGTRKFVNGKQKFGKYAYPIIDNAKWFYFDTENWVYSYQSFAVAYEMMGGEAAVKKNMGDESFDTLKISDMDSVNFLSAYTLGSPPSNQYWKKMNYARTYVEPRNDDNEDSYSPYDPEDIKGCGLGWSCSNCPNVGCPANELN